MLFLIGLITSVHCIAMCGGINLSQSITFSTKRNSKFSALKPTLLYNIGRVISYTSIGCVLGFIGFLFGGNSDSALPTFLQGLLKIFAGIFMIIVGFNMLGILPKLNKLIPRMPKAVTKKVNAEKAKYQQPLIVGLLNGFMPCGPLYSMHIVALALANPLIGGLSMLVFSLGTVPLMLGIGSIVSLLGRKFSQAVMLVGSVLVIIMGLAMLSQGGSLSGMISSELILVAVIVCAIFVVISSIDFKKTICKTTAIIATSVIILVGAAIYCLNGITLSSTLTQPEISAKIVDGVQVVNSTLKSGDYPDITVEAGIPVKWIIDAPEGSVNGCNYSIILNDFNLTYDLHKGENVIEFTPESSGTYVYTCWMGMIRGNITVI